MIFIHQYYAFFSECAPVFLGFASTIVFPVNIVLMAAFQRWPFVARISLFLSRDFNLKCLVHIFTLGCVAKPI